MASLFEKYRPRAFDDVLGQDKAIARIKTVLAKRFSQGAQNAE